MTTWADISELHFSSHRDRGPLPTVTVALLESVRRHGPIAPVIVRTVRLGYEILSNGETWLALQRLGQYEVPIEIRDDLSDNAAAEIVALGNLENANDALEEARLIQVQVTEIGSDKYGAISKVARQLGLTRSYVSHALRLLELPEPVRDLLRRGQLKVGHVKPLVSIEDAEDCLGLARKIAFEKLTVREAEALTRAHRSGESMDGHSDGSGSNDADVSRLERELTEQLGCAVHLVDGQLVIDYGDRLDVLDGVLAQMGYVAD